MKSEQKLLSVITVVKNGEKTIERALQSVISQKQFWCEYIVIDGVSSDGTVDKICAKLDKIDYFYSEPDLGIYDAMNKGISRAHGDYVSFLNADDWYEKDALLNIESWLMKRYDIVYGGVRRLYEGVEVGFVGSYGEINPDDIFYTNLYCHQGMFIKRELFKRVGMYNTAYKVFADYDWNIRAYENNVNIKTIDLIVANSDDGGASTDKTWCKCKEVISITKRFCNDDLARSRRIKTCHDNLITDFKYRYIVARHTELLCDIFEERYEFYLWGTGKMLNDAEELLRVLNVKTCGYIDSFRDLGELNGIKVYFPSEIYKKIVNDENNKKYIIISTTKYEKEVYNQITNWNIPWLCFDTFSNIKKNIAGMVDEIELEKSDFSYGIRGGINILKSSS